VRSSRHLTQSPSLPALFPLYSIDIDRYTNVSTPQERAVLAAHSIQADFISPVGTAYASNVTDPTLPGYISFVTPAMVDLAHSLDIQVKPWTINRLNVVEGLMEMGVDGLIVSRLP
jgi:glycerophosphoryl diester phosphodiesterase